MHLNLLTPFLNAVHFFQTISCNYKNCLMLNSLATCKCDIMFMASIFYTIDSHRRYSRLDWAVQAGLDFSGSRQRSRPPSLAESLHHAQTNTACSIAPSLHHAQTNTACSIAPALHSCNRIRQHNETSAFENNKRSVNLKHAKWHRAIDHSIQKPLKPTRCPMKRN